MKSGALLATVILTLSVWIPRPSQAADQQVKTTFVRLGPGVPGVLYEPVTPGPKSAIAVFAMHSEVDYLEFSACTELSKRGYRVLCATNTTTAQSVSAGGAETSPELQH